MVPSIPQLGQQRARAVPLCVMGSASCTSLWVMQSGEGSRLPRDGEVSCRCPDLGFSRSPESAEAHLCDGASAHMLKYQRNAAL